MKPFSRNNPATPGVPMVYQPAKLDHLYSDELAARLCREYTEECVTTLVEHMRNKRQSAISLAATNSILDRGFGKPKEIKTLSGPDGGTPKIRVLVEFIDPGHRDDGESIIIDQAPQPVFDE